MALINSILIQGTPASGKGLLIEKLREALRERGVSCSIVALGPFFRRNDRGNLTEEDKKLLQSTNCKVDYSVMNNGLLMPSDFAISVAEYYLKQECAVAMKAYSQGRKHIIICDGFPRKPIEASWFKDTIMRLGLCYFALVYLQVSKDVCWKRLSLGVIRDGGRADDHSEEIFNERWKAFEETAPIVRSVLSASDNIVPKECLVVNAENDPDTVFKDVWRRLEPLIFTE